MKARLLSIFCALLMSVGIQAQNAEFESATEAVKNMKIGWNLWNTLESVVPLEEFWSDPEQWQSWETAWGNPVTKPELMKMVRKAGFNAIRVPVTWYHHMDKNDKVDPEWMKRVHDVVDYVIDQGMYCILNTHHDNGAWLIADMANYEQYHEKFEYLWKQIAEEFKDYDGHLLFEAYNEVCDKYGEFHLPKQDQGTEHIQQAYDAINNYAQSFVDAVRSTGGKNLERNLVVDTYSALVGPWEEHGESCRQMKIPTDVSEGHIIFAIHCYWMGSKKDVDGVISNVDKYIESRGIPTIVGEWGAFNEGNHFEDYHGYFLEQTKANGITTFLWGGVSGGEMRTYPAFGNPEETKDVLKAYYGNDYEPTLLTTDDYEFQYYPTSLVTFQCLYAQLGLCSRVLSLDDYAGIRIEMENTEDIHVLINGDGEGKQQRCWFSASSETFYFDKSILGEKVMGFELQNMRDGKNETKIYNVYLTKKDGSEEKLGKEETTVVWGCDLDNGKWIRKQFAHTVAYDYLWAELNIFYDDIPLKLKNYKGIRLELAETPKDVNIKVYGDGEQKEDYLPPLTETSTTILFNTDIFSNEINRITLQNAIDGKNEVKVISAWLIRQDGTEEYSDLSPFWGCEITSKTEYATGINPIKVMSIDNAPHRIYNLNGQRLEKPQKGINIIDGKKVLVK